MKRASIIYYLGLIALIAIVLYNHFFAFFGHNGSDDLYYAALAKQLNDGTLHLTNDHYAFRWGILLPVAICYRLFGINDFSTALPAFISTLLCLFLIHRFTREWNYPFRLLALSLFLLQQWTLFYADKLMPDSILTLFVFIASLLLLYHRNCHTLNRKKTIIISFLLSLSLICALMVKETVVLFLPLLLIVAIIDLAKKRFTFFWLMNLVWGITLIGIYILVIKFLTGSFSARFTALKEGAYLNPCSYDQLPLINTLRRIGLELWSNWIDSGQMIALLLILPALSLFNFKSFINNNSKEAFLFIGAIILVLSANFMSISLHSYVPMCPDPRHFLYLSPILALAGAAAFKSYYNSSKRIMLFIITALIAFWAWENNSEAFKTIWLALPIAFLATIFIRKESRLALVIPFAIIFCLLARDIDYMQYSASTQYCNQEKIIQQYLNKPLTRTVVYTDVIESRYGYYYNGFDSSKIVFIAYTDARAADTSRFVKQYVLLNPFTSYYCSQNIDALPAALKTKADKATLVVRMGDKELREINP